MIFLPALGGVAVYLAGRLATRAASTSRYPSHWSRAALAFVAYYSVFAAEGPFGISSFVLQESTPGSAPSSPTTWASTASAGRSILDVRLLTALATGGSFFEIRTRKPPTTP